MKNLIFVIGFFLLACAGSKEVIQQDVDTEIVLVYDESFDPLSLEDDDIVIGIESKAADSDQETFNNSQDALSIKEINGFRIQILATNNIEKASLAEQVAAERFKYEGHKTYLLFEAPLYKIRVGDCKTRQEADNVQALAKKYGYAEAFLVKSKIIISENN